ncbi:uncharacterized protein AB675_11118 [Cyphellophora attinorum]|uniref:RNase III domain-containing protein n=1 Tax=Cyphellophora attinorum TaxID=1664694 RepID=A0A0N1NXY4_9EURO|nr:uncharacterized protein AB675_11118 [Phialophora attinorum]KPI35780.1 hypothetical protein AB675_11118 [Phialophora attinorum]
MKRYAVHTGIYQCVLRPTGEVAGQAATVFEAVLGAVHLDELTEDALKPTRNADDWVYGRDWPTPMTETSAALAQSGDIGGFDSALLLHRSLDEENGAGDDNADLRTSNIEATEEVLVTTKDPCDIPEVLSSPSQGHIDSNKAKPNEPGAQAFKLEDVFIERVGLAGSLLGFKFEDDNIAHAAAALDAHGGERYIHGKAVRNKIPLASHGTNIIANYFWRHWLASRLDKGEECGIERPLPSLSEYGRAAREIGLDRAIVGDGEHQTPTDKILSAALRALLAVVHFQAGEDGVHNVMKNAGLAVKLFPFAFESEKGDADEPDNEHTSEMAQLQEQIAEIHEDLGELSKTNKMEQNRETSKRSTAKATRSKKKSKKKKQGTTCEQDMRDDGKPES